MNARLLLLVCMLLSAGLASAADRRFTSDEEAERWSGVGLLSRSDGGSCTATLIRPDVVLTAAHCVADTDSQSIFAADELAFSAGVRDGTYLDRAAAIRVQIHPGYFASGRSYGPRQVRVDVARITLARPLRDLPVYRVDLTPSVGADVALVSYSQGRTARVSIQSPCRITGRETEFLRLDCISDPGASGAPYFRLGRDGEARIVGINSGSRQRGAERSALALGLDHVRDFIGATGGAYVSEPTSRFDPNRKTRLPGASTPGDGLSRVKQ